MTDWSPFREPLRVTLSRTVGLALLLGALLALQAGGLARWPALSLLLLWPAVGGHYLDLLFLNWIRPRIPHIGSLQRGARLALWFAGGILLALGMRLTAQALGEPLSLAWLTWAAAGALFVAIELGAHVALLLRHRPNFYDGLG